MIIGLDYDGCTNLDHNTWIKFIELFRQAGHEVYLVTMRYPSEVTGPKATDPVPDIVLNSVNGWHATSRQAKDKFMRDQGIVVNVWVDDNPKAVIMSAKEIWGWCSEEGHVFSENYATTPEMDKPTG